MIGSMAVIAFLYLPHPLFINIPSSHTYRPSVTESAIRLKDLWLRSPLTCPLLDRHPPSLILSASVWLPFSLYGMSWHITLLTLARGTRIENTLPLSTWQHISEDLMLPGPSRFLRLRWPRQPELELLLLTTVCKGYIPLRDVWGQATRSSLNESSKV